MASQYSLGILFRIFRNLLKLVNNNYNRLFAMLYEVKNFFERIFRMLNVAQLYVKSRESAHRVKTKCSLERFKCSKEASHPRLAL